MLSNILDTVAEALEQVWCGNFARLAGGARGQGGACLSAQGAGARGARAQGGGGGRVRPKRSQKS